MRDGQTIECIGGPLDGDRIWFPSPDVTCEHNSLLVSAYVGDDGLSRRGVICRGCRSVGCVLREEEETT